MQHVVFTVPKILKLRKITYMYIVTKYKIFLYEIQVFRKWDVVVWTGSSWLRIGTGGRHL